MKTQKGFLILIAFAVTSAGCRKQVEYNTAVPVNESGYQRSVAAVTKEVAGALMEVYADHKALMEVNAAIASGYYADERVLLKDLLFPSQSELYRSESFTKFKIDTGVFRRRFCEIIERGNYPLLAAELKPAQRTIGSVALHARIISDSTASILSPLVPVSIYFPYSENFGKAQIFDSLPPNSKLAMVLKPTIVYTDRDADNAPGKRPYLCSNAGTKVCYLDVNVNDDYAEIVPTHIVTVGALAAAATTPVVPKSELVTRTYHGSSRLTKQMDKLVSFTGNGGGSEIKVCRVNAYLRRTDEQVTDLAGDLITLNYTRADIRKKRWKRVYAVWDPNWNYQDIEQIYAVYEDDTYGSKTISGSLTTTVNLPGKIGKAEGEVGFKISVITQDDIITQRKIDRKSFLRDGLNNQGWGFLKDGDDFLAGVKDWPVIDGGAIWSYTFPYRIY
ncbi:MAG: hypothetical protein JNK79_01825 [Chitinophagaceae bacterium]|nr:hypothetical protein [Chitinophagaceae bacterium]